MTKIQSFGASLFLILFAASALAKDYPVSRFSLLLAVKCGTDQPATFAVSPNGFQASAQLRDAVSGTVANQVFGNQFTGEAQGFHYAIDAEGSVVLTKRRPFLDLLGHDTSLTLGVPNAASVAVSCRENARATEALPQMVPIDLRPNLQLRESLEWTGACFLHSLWPNQPGDAFYKPYDEKLTFSDTQSATTESLATTSAVEVGNSNQAGASLDACNAAELP